MHTNKSKKIKKPWPTKKVMEQIYNQKLWGDNNSEFYSGFGSHDSLLVKPYIKVVKEFLTSFKEPITICDLGCGDFNIGKQLVEYSKSYIAVDLVEDLIRHNIQKFKEDNLEFNCLNISEEKLPKADCIILRQVLQHLSNEEVQSVVKKLASFKYIILTEHIPKGSFDPNVDIISGQGIRLRKKSGLDILAPPFNLKIKEKKELVVINLDDEKGVVSTFLYKLF